MITRNWIGEDSNLTDYMGMGFGMGLVWLLVIGVLVLSIAALWKYLRSGKN